MRILPYQRQTIETFLPPEEIVRRLMAELNPSPSMFATSRRLKGWIVGDVFEIRAQTSWWFNSVRSVGKGRIVRGPGGANLELTLTLDPVGRVFMSLWLWVAAAIFIGLGIAYLRDTTFGREVGPIVLAMLPLGYLTCLILFRVDAAHVIYHLRRLLGGLAR